MDSWKQVRWAEAGQIADVMNIPRDAVQDSAASPQQAFDMLRKRGETQLALRFLAHALPRLEAVAWAAQLLDQWSANASLTSPRRQALDHSLRWLGEPADEYRRAALEAADQAPEDSPERLLGYAVFMSGGSISQPDLPAIQPPQQVCAQLASAAVLVAAYRTDSPAAALDAACALGEKIAANGVQGAVPS